MAFTLSRVDAIYSAPFVSPALELVGEIPRLIRAVYQAFADRYPGLPVSAFKALNSNMLSEVGLSISLLGACPSNRAGGEREHLLLDVV